jgi:hypothetical protein
MMTDQIDKPALLFDVTLPRTGDFARWRNWLRFGPDTRFDRQSIDNLSRVVIDPDRRLVTGRSVEFS